jgi:hypothetical protein
MDVNGAYLNGTLEEENLVCKLVKSLYGLKQAGRVWNETLNDYLIKCGSKRGTADTASIPKPPMEDTSSSQSTWMT